MPGNMFYIRSRGLLDDQANLVLQRWETSLAANDPGVVSHEELVDAFSKQKELSVLLKESRDALAMVSLAKFPYLLPHQKEALRRALIRAHYLHAVQCRIDETQWRWDGLDRNKQYCQQYQYFLARLLDDTAAAGKTKPEAQLNDRCVDSEKPFAWFGMVVLAPIFSKQLMDVCSGKLAFIKRKALELEQKGAYLGWSRTLLLSVMSMLPNIFANQSKSQTLLEQAGPGLSYLGFFAVQMCMAIEILILTKNTFAGAWMTRHHDLKIPVWEQFTIQLELRKYVLLNWLALSVISLVSFLWLMQVLQAAPWGPFLSVGYQIYKLCIMSCRYDTELTTHHALIEQLRGELMLLDEKKARLHERLKGVKLSEKKSLEMELMVLQEEKNTLTRLRGRYISEWRFNTVEYRQQMMYTLGILSGASLWCSLAFPPVAILPATVLIIGLTGAAICFTSIILFSAARGRLDLEKTTEKQGAVHEQLMIYLEAFSRLKARGDDPAAQMEMKQIYLEMKELVAFTEYQQRLLAHQQITLVVQIFRDALLPIIALASLVFLPTGIGIGMIVAACLLSMLVHQLMRRYEPTQPEKYVFDEASYAEFVAMPHHSKLLAQEKSRAYRERFFHANKDRANTYGPLLELDEIMDDDDLVLGM